MRERRNRLLSPQSDHPPAGETSRSGSTPSESTPIESTEDALRRHNRELQRQLDELKKSLAQPAHAAPATRWRPSSVTIWAIFLGVLILSVVAFFAGYLPLQARRAV